MDLTTRTTGQDTPSGIPEDEATGPSAGPVTPSPGASNAVRVAVVAVLAVGVVARFTAVSHLWLDEALTVNIARLPLSRLPDALRHDGAPPVYYVLLHAWMDAFGTKPLVVRALAGLFGVIALPLTWVAAARVGGTRASGNPAPARRAAWSAVVLLAVSPFALRYSTEGRMYTLVSVEVLVGFLAVLNLLDGGGWRPAAVLAAATGAALLTHYWSFYLVAVAVVALLLVARSGSAPARTGARRALGGIAAGGVLFLPWAPVFLYQLRHTGTPWGSPGTFQSIFDTVFQFAGGYWEPGILLGLLYFGLVALAVFGSGVDRRHVLLDLRTRPPGRWLAAVTFGALAVAIVAGQVGHSAFAVRYAAGLFALFVLVLGVGASVFLDARVHNVVLAVAVLAGLWAAAPNAFGERTSAAKVAAALAAHASPGDVVAYCPDQLGPAVSRVLQGGGLVQLTFPRAASPDRVDWVNYAKVNRAANTAAFARMLLERAGPAHDVWVVWAPGYQTYGVKCQSLLNDLDDARPANERVVKVSSKYFERPGLVRFHAPAGD